VIRLAFLREHPLCVLCSELAEVPDHWPVKRADLVAAGVDDPDAFERMRPLCLSCHARYGER
jgi:5-methylcytosine-specific restriction protein A